MDYPPYPLDRGTKTGYGTICRKSFAERQFAESQFAERQFAERQFAETQFADVKDNLPIIIRQIVSESILAHCSSANCPYPSRNVFYNYFDKLSFVSRFSFLISVDTFWRFQMFCDALFPDMARRFWLKIIKFNESTNQQYTLKLISTHIRRTVSQVFFSH